MKYASANDFEKLFSEVDKRIDGLHRVIIERVVDKLSAQIKALAPEDNVLPGYKDAIEPVSVRESPGVYAVAVHEIENTSKASDKAEDFTVLNLEKLQDFKGDMSVIDFLISEGPYTMDTFPIDKAIPGSKIVYRLVTAKEVGNVRKINTDRSGVVNAKLGSMGIQIKKISPDADVHEDIPFKIMRAELGMNKIKPHWRPALQAYKGNFNINSELITLLISDPESTIYERPSIIPEEIGSETAQSFDKFGKIIK